MSNKVAVVTGASRGIGKRVSVDLASKGYDVVCTARSTSASPGKLEGTIDETASLVEEQGTKAMAVGLDVRVNGPFYFMHAFAPRMDQGRAINISSGASLAPQFNRASYTVTKRALEALTECHAWELRDKVAVNCIQLELSVWTEGYTATLGEGNYEGFEDPVIMSDAVLWLAEQPIDYTGHILTIAAMREMGVVRPPTKVGQS